jgi:hypothetical protein
VKVSYVLVAVAVLAATVLAPVATTPTPAEARTPRTTTAAASTQLPTLLGWGAGTGSNFREQLPQFTEATGKPPAFSMLPFTVEQDWSAPWIPGLLTDLEELGTQPYIELTTTDLSALASGRADGQLAAMVDTLAGWLGDRAGRRILLAPLPEMNLTEHAWGGRPAAYKQAYHRIRAAFQDAGVTAGALRLVFAPNGISSPGFGYPEFYPGDGAVDLVGFAKINRGSPWRDYAETFQRHIDEMRRTVTTTKPILITQTGSVDDPRRPGWLHDMFTKLDSHGQVIGAVYFNRNKDHDYRVLEDGRLDPTFRDDYRDLWSDPAARRFVFDGSLDAWVTARGGTPAARFADTATSAFREPIAWVAAEAITTGCRPDFYCPATAVTRGQMASFLTRALGLPASDEDRFVDDDRSPHEAAIQAVAAAGITAGCNPAGDRFCPDAPVTRAQMAAFLDAALDLPPAEEEDAFTDDDRSHHEAAIDRVASAGITSGCTDTRFCPGARVTRAQMAAFLHRALT